LTEAAQYECAYCGTAHHTTGIKLIQYLVNGLCETEMCDIFIAADEQDEQRLIEEINKVCSVLLCSPNCFSIVLCTIFGFCLLCNMTDFNANRTENSQKVIVDLLLMDKKRNCCEDENENSYKKVIRRIRTVCCSVCNVLSLDGWLQ